MQKMKFSITCPEALLSNPYWSHPSMKNSASMIHAPEHRNALREVQIPPDAKTKVHYNVSQHYFCGIRTGPTRA
jgi:hypothetical protein